MPGVPDATLSQPDDDPRRWAMLALVSLAMLLSLSAWMTCMSVIALIFKFFSS